MQLRMSPGGRMRFSRRRRPELPPSSVTVTMAARSEMGRSAVACSSVRRMTCSLRPRRSVERPVPPPRATTRKLRENLFGLDGDFFTVGFCEAYPRHCTERRINTEYRERRTQSHRDRPEVGPTAGGAVFLRIEKFGEARIFLEEGEILVVAGVIAIFRAQLNGDLQIGHGGIGFAGEAIERGQRVMNVVGFGRGFAGFDEAFAGVVPAADVHHGHAALVMLLGGAGILFRGRLHALLGDLDVHAGAVGEFFAGAFQNFFEFLLGSWRISADERAQSASS